MKLTISRKLLLGYLLMALLTVVASAYALASLQRLSSVAYNITNNHISVMERSKKMLDILMAQERAEKKYLLLAGYISGVKPQETFLGHIGGDDFVVIGRPDQVESICQRLVADFEPRIHSFYEEQDAQNGYFIGRNRQGIVQKLPLITVTAAIVTDDGSRFRSPLEMARKVAQLKEYAKSLPGSNYVHERDLPDEEALQLENLQALAEADNAQRK